MIICPVLFPSESEDKSSSPSALYQMSKTCPVGVSGSEVVGLGVEETLIPEVQLVTIGF